MVPEQWFSPKPETLPFCFLWVVWERKLGIPIPWIAKNNSIKRLARREQGSTLHIVSPGQVSSWLSQTIVACRA